MSVGRRVEGQLVRSFLERVAGGRGGVLAVRGEPGIGKTTLCETLLADAPPGLRVIRVDCIAGEGAIPHAALHLTLAQLDVDVAALPAAQAEAAEWVLGRRGGSPPPQLAVAVATLATLAEAGGAGPLVVFLDDLHWGDQASSDALLFAGRRLGDDPVALLVTVRDHEGQDLDLRGCEVVDLAGMDGEETAELLEHCRGRRPAESTNRELCARTGGNPLALVTVARDLTDQQLDGVEALPAGLGADAVARLVGSRLEPLAADVRLALCTAASSRTGSAAEIVAALRQLGVADAEAAVEAAEHCGLIDVAGAEIAFSHPLVREACRLGVPAGERRRCHAALAEVVEGDEGTWHRAAATLGPDEEVATALEDLARRLAASGAHAEAAFAWDRAVELGEDRAARPHRLAESGRCHRTAGRLDVAEARLAAALDEVGHEPRVGRVRRSEVQLLRGNISVWQGRLRHARDLLQAEARRLEERNPFQAAVLLLQSLVGLLHAGELAAAADLASWARDLGERAGSPIAESTAAVDGYIRALRGEPAGEGPVIAAAGLFEALEPFVDATPITLATTSFVGSMLVHVEALDDAEHMLDATIAAARRTGATGQLPITLSHRAELHLRRGEWRSAARDADEAVQLAAATGQALPLIVGRVRALQIAAHRGDEAGATREALDEVLHDPETRAHAPAQALALSAIGTLELGEGRHSAAADALSRLAGRWEASGLRHPGITPYWADLAEARLRAGDRTGAEAALDTLWRQAKAVRGRWPIAAATRVQGVLADDDDLDLLHEAVALSEPLGMPFEHGRALLDLGARLRRRGQPRDARVALRDAQQRFHELGASAWEAAAAGELRASGERRAAAKPPDGIGSLSPQELRIAAAVAAGATNREAAAELFLSPKTVENHLGRIYAKLGVRSRTELSRLMPTVDG